VLVGACLILWPGLVLALAQATGGQKEVLIGVRANRGADVAIARWQPTADHLSRSIPGYHFKLVPYEINSSLNQAVSRDAFQFVLTNSASYVELEGRYGTHCLLTLINKRHGQGYTQYGSVIFTRSNRDDIKSLPDLDGKTIMGVDENGFGGWRMAWREFLEDGINPYTDFEEVSFAGGIQQNVVYAVADGKVDAGVVRTDMLESMAAKGRIARSDFKVLALKKTRGFDLAHSTALYPEWPFAKTRHTNDALAQKVAFALLRIRETDEAAVKGNYVGWHTPLDYSPVDNLLKELHIGPYAGAESFTFKEVFYAYWYVVLAALLVIVFFLVLISRMQLLNSKLRTTEQRLLASNQQLKDLSVLDGLTGLGNRHMLHEFLEFHWGRACRDASQVCVLMLDIDFFKNYNDTYGHIAGDDCLKATATVIEDLYRRSTELAVRYGGEEFLIISVDCDPAVCRQQAEKLRADVESLKIEHKASHVRDVVTVSIGMVSFRPHKNKPPQAYIRLADKALYRAKQNGRNRLFELKEDLENA
jgi:diguanylate cyclase (GGDEF)-like protein